ncbi:MAG: hypothetical protein H7257_11350, partial [Taibaiella sp.]|nr:hypothetical protein [Taibaiella sp.]
MSTQSTKKSTQRSVSALVAALTRSESGKLVAVLTRIFGTHNLGLAEDAVQDVLLKALEVWQADGVPENPAAWLFTAARNKAIDTVRKYRRQRVFAVDITPLLESENTVATTLNNCFRDEEI